ncbi:MAG: ribosome biogenesis GTP-binding protein YihA/YsxC [Cyclobacteriaceae bacterium]|nr:ribosome biogenesis GTP-binding protein YihA/YsxC [Cyclobacteriaceae bacterium]
MKELSIQAEFAGSVTLHSTVNKRNLPEFALAGRSNVGKSSLINMLTGRSRLAHVSATPGKTQTINYYLIDNRWYLVDLPGYGYARRSLSQKKMFSKLITHYLLNAPELHCVFVLLDSRIPVQQIDLDFINWLGESEVPLALVLTKTDKLSGNLLAKNKMTLENELRKYWDELPPLFLTSSKRKTGRKELLQYIHSILANS